ncbi:MAG: hypothetical protein ABIJ27_01025 [Candidatus Omnitrophota bacterium]
MLFHIDVLQLEFTRPFVDIKELLRVHLPHKEIHRAVELFQISVNLIPVRQVVAVNVQVFEIQPGILYSQKIDRIRIIDREEFGAVQLAFLHKVIGYVFHRLCVFQHGKRREIIAPFASFEVDGADPVFFVDVFDKIGDRPLGGIITVGVTQVNNDRRSGARVMAVFYIPEVMRELKILNRNNSVRAGPKTYAACGRHRIPSLIRPDQISSE